MTVAAPAQMADSAEMLRGLLAVADSGDLYATSAADRALVRHSEGAAVAFEKAAGVRH